MVNYSTIKRVAQPLWKWVLGEPKILQFLGPIHRSRTVSHAEGFSPANVASVCNLATGEETEIIVSVVLESVLTENYPLESYVGKTFEISQYQTPGKRYKSFTVAEIAVTE